MAFELSALADVGCPLCKLGTLNFGNLQAPACNTGTAPPAPLYNQLSQFLDSTGTRNFWLGGVGTRDVDTNVTITNITTPDFTTFSPAGTSISDAYIYWNILAAHDVTADTIIFDGNGPFTGTLVGWCNDTCWQPFNDGSNQDGGYPPQNIYNRVYRYNVSAFVALTGGTYRVELPGISTNASVATAGSDSAHYPGCNGSQGVALLILYEDGTTRRIIVHDGCVLMTPPNYGFGGYSTYSVTIDPGFFITNAVIANAAGDTQTQYADTLRYNGTAFPGNGFGSYFNPNANGGDVLQSPNLLFTGAAAGQNAKESVILADFATPAIANCPNSTTVDITSGVECLDWFLHVYAAEDSECCIPAADPSGLHNQLNLFKSYLGDYDSVLAGTGTRDTDMAGVGTSILVPAIPGTIVEAYLYWDVFVSNQYSIATFEPVVFAGLPSSGTYVGWGDNTCWCACDPGDESNTACNYATTIKNRTYRLDVGPTGTNQVLTGGPTAYTVKLPTTVLHPLPLCTKCPDTPHYPGCAGTQGVALFIVYTDPGNTRHILLYDGCAVVIPDGFTPYVNQPGYQSSYSVAVNSTFSTDAYISLAVGDAQSDFADRLQWNSQTLPPQPNHFTPNQGNLLWTETTPVKAFAGPCCNKPGNTVTVSTPDDCLCWFIFAYKAKKCCTPETVIQCAQPVVSNNNQRFVSP